MSKPASILIVDDDPGILRLLSIRLKSADYQVLPTESAEEALSVLEGQTPDIVITDLRMDGMDGMALFEQIQQRHPSLPVIILTAHGSIPEAVAATKRGVFGFLTKPFDGTELLQQVEDALRATGAGNGGQGDDAAADSWGEHITTRSARMKEVIQRARMVADSDASIFIAGESGTGKEVLARAIHGASQRRDEAFVAVNCGAIPEALLESELFGHRKGAFTGADKDREGLFKAADGGTLFLDEIGDMPLNLQVKLLRVLQERHIRPLGGSDSIQVNVRVISATHRDLKEAMAEGEFREDLYYRLHVVALELPPLRERREDIPLLAQAFLKEMATRYQKKISRFSGEAMERMLAAPWPGNIRQLKNVVEQSVILSATSVIPDAMVQQIIHDTGEAALAPFADARREFERDYLVQLLQMTRGNVTQAAKLAQRNRTEFYKLLNRHNLAPAHFKDDLV